MFPNSTKVHFVLLTMLLLSIYQSSLGQPVFSGLIKQTTKATRVSEAIGTLQHGFIGGSLVPQKDVPILKSLGIKWVRVEVDASIIKYFERGYFFQKIIDDSSSYVNYKDHYGSTLKWGDTLDIYKEYLTALKDNGITPYIVFDWGLNDTGADQRRIQDTDPKWILGLVSSFVQKYKGYVNYWELWNEPENFYFVHKYGSYPCIMSGCPWIAPYISYSNAAADTIKKYQPDAYIISTGSGATDAMTTSLISQTQTKVNSIGLHPYSGNSNIVPEGICCIYGNILKILTHAMNFGKDLWITEFGWRNDGSHNIEYGEATSQLGQMKYIARSLFLFSTYGNAKVCSQFDWNGGGAYQICKNNYAITMLKSIKSALAGGNRNVDENIFKYSTKQVKSITANMFFDTDNYWDMILVKDTNTIEYVFWLQRVNDDNFTGIPSTMFINFSATLNNISSVKYYDLKESNPIQLNVNTDYSIKNGQIFKLNNIKVMDYPIILEIKGNFSPGGIIPAYKILYSN